MAPVCFSLLPKLAASPPSLKSPPGLCQAASETDAQTSYSISPNIQRTRIYAAPEPNTQTQVPQMCAVRAAQFLARLSHRTRTICFVSEAIWSERSHRGIGTEGGNGAFCTDIRGGSQEGGFLIPRIPAEHLKEAFSVIVDLLCMKNIKILQI